MASLQSGIGSCALNGSPVPEAALAELRRRVLCLDMCVQGWYILPEVISMKASRTERIDIRTTAAEKMELVARAAAMGLTVSAYLLYMAGVRTGEALGDAILETLKNAEPGASERGTRA